MRVPAAASWSGVRPLTVAWVPTGMNVGVSTGPWGVVSRPVRAAPSRAVTAKVRGGLLTDGNGMVEVQARGEPLPLGRAHTEQKGDLGHGVPGQPGVQVLPKVVVTVDDRLAG